MEPSTIHASAVLVGANAVLIRGPSGSGKSRLAWDLVQASDNGDLPFSRLVADDRAYVEVHGSRVLVRPPPQLAGLIEIHGLGIRCLPYEPVAAVGWVIDLASPEGGRMPAKETRETLILGVAIPHLSVAPGADALPLVLAWLRTTASID
ncbi:MAG TPA: serine kinase [Pseudolabrys sp.]|nr:serine kinase [Pseudolabrys sp.]